MLPSGAQSGLAALSMSGAGMAAPVVASCSSTVTAFEVRICFPSGENEKKFDPPPPNIEPAE